MFDKVCTAGIFFALIFSVVGAFAQSDEGALDPSGWVTKYDTSFTGIGPQVYVLPPPRSREEVLVDSYQEKKGFYDSIARQLDFQGLLEEYQFTSNANYLEKTYAPFPKIEHKWDSLITSLEQKNNLPLVAGLRQRICVPPRPIWELSKSDTSFTAGFKCGKASWFW